MKLIITTLLIFFSAIICGQNKIDTLIAYGAKQYEELENIKREYDRLQINKDIFIYRENARKPYGFYVRAKYDSLLRNTNQNDSIVLVNSRLKLNYKGNFYIKLQNRLHDGNYGLVKYNSSNKAIESFSSSSGDQKGVIITNFINNTTFSYWSNFPDAKNYNIYEFTKFNSNFSKILYKKIMMKKDSSVIEYNYEKDFPISKEEILKQLPEKFYKQAPQLMKGKKYSYDWKNWSQELTAKNAKRESEDFKLLIHKNEVGLEQRYNENNIPFYEAIIIGAGYHRKHWLLKINPKSGDIYYIEFGTLIE